MKTIAQSPRQVALSVTPGISHSRTGELAAAGISGDNEKALQVRPAHLSPDFSIRYSTGSGYRFYGL